MFSRKWLQSTAEWVVVAVASAVLGGLTDGVDDWPAFWRTVGIAAGVALVKCVLATRAGATSLPQFVEPDPVIRPVVVPQRSEPKL